MSVRASILQRLIHSRNVAVEKAIELALPRAPGAEQMELAEVLLERNRRSGWVALIRNFDRLEEGVKQKVLSRPRDLFGPLAETMHDSEGPARENVIAIVRACADGKLVYLLSEALMDARPEVRELAGKSLLEAVRRYRATMSAGGEAQEQSDPGTLEQMRRAIDFALRQYKTHRQQPAVLAALISERQQDAKLWAYFQDAYDDLTRAATAIIRHPGEPALASAVLLALGSALKPAAAAGIASAEGPVAEAIAWQSYRLLDPALRIPAQTITHFKALFLSRREPLWNSGNWREWLRLIESIGLQPAQRLGVLTRMAEFVNGAAAQGEASARVVWKLELLRALFAVNVADAGAIIATFVSDADERVARSAARHLLHRRFPEWRDLALLALGKSPHIFVRKMAVGLQPSNLEGASRQPKFEKVWSEYPTLPPAVQTVTTRDAGTQDPAFAEQLRLKLASVHAIDIAQGLKMLSVLPDLAPYRAQIIGLCGNPDARIASVAVRLVGRLEDPRLKDLLEAAALHKDPRVRANAIASMEALHIADRSQQVLAMLNSRHNRERANAIKAISQFDYNTARECLARMLADPNPMHRISALWVVSQLQMLEIVRQVSSMARRDPNVRVRRRAADMLETLAGAPASPGASA